MSVGTPFHARTSAANRALAWRNWAGYVAASTYSESLDIEYAAIRDAAALIDVSPLYKYRVSGPDALALVDRVITRRASLLADPGRVIYSPWCDEAGKVIDDGTLAALDDGSIRWTAADPQLRWLRLNAGGLDVTIEDISEEVAAVALQGPRSRDVLEAATGAPWADLPYYRRRAAAVRDPVDVSRTGYTGDLGFELWVDAARAVDLWDALVDAGEGHALRPAGLAALDLARLEAGLILLEVDYTSSRHALAAAQAYSPGEIGLGHLVDLGKPSFVGRRALLAERAAGGPPRRLVGLVLDWDGIERLSLAHGLPPVMASGVSRAPVPVFDAFQRQIGRVTSSGWSPTLKQLIGLASVAVPFARSGGRVDVEWSVEGERGLVAARVVDLPFLDLQRKRA